MRTAFAVLSSCVLLALSFAVSPASAGEYYGGGYNGDGYYRAGYYGNGYHRRSGGGVWYSSSCCYKRITRHESRYVRVDPYRRYGYYGPYRRPWREGYYQPYRHSYYGRPVSYGDVYVSPPRRYYGYYDRPRYGGYDAYNSASIDVTPTCVSRRAPVLDGRGGWVWGFKRVCY